MLQYDQQLDAVDRLKRWSTSAAQRHRRRWN